MDRAQRGTKLGCWMELSLPHLINLLDHPDSLQPLHDRRSPEGFRDAAVIVPLVQRDGKTHLIFNKRAANLDNHAGQVGFPGGRRDPEDTSLLITAQRELDEELSIAPDQHRPLLRLPPRLVISHYQVTPFVSLVNPDANIIAEPGEVAYTFEVPLEFLMDPSAATSARRDIFGETRVFYAWDYAGETIWGATGRIIADFLIAIGARHLEA